MKNIYLPLFIGLLFVWGIKLTNINIENRYGNDTNEYIISGIRYLYPNDVNKQFEEYKNIYKNHYSIKDKEANNHTNPLLKNAKDYWTDKTTNPFFEIKPLFPFLAASITKAFPSFTILESFMLVSSVSMMLCFLLIFFWIKKELNEWHAFLLSFFLLLFYPSFGYISVLIFPDTLSTLLSLLFLFLVYYSTFPVVWGLVFLLAALTRQDNLLFFPLAIFIFFYKKLMLNNIKSTKTEYGGLLSLIVGLIIYFYLSLDLMAFAKYSHFQNFNANIGYFLYIPFAIPQSTFPYFALPLVVALPFMHRKYLLFVIIALFLILIKLILFPKFIDRYFLSSYLLIFIVSWITIIKKMRTLKSED